MIPPSVNDRPGHNGEVPREKTGSTLIQGSSFRGLTRLYVALVVVLWYLPWAAIGVVARPFAASRSFSEAVALIDNGTITAVTIPPVGEVTLPGTSRIEEVEPAISACVGGGSRAGWEYEVRDELSGARVRLEWHNQSPPSQSDADEILTAARRLPKGFKIDDSPTIDQPLIAGANGARLSPNAFAERVKERFPGYRDVDDVVLARRVVAKYPIYATWVDLPPLAQLVCWRGHLFQETEFRSQASFRAVAVRTLNAAGYVVVSAIIVGPLFVYSFLVALAIVVRWVVAGFTGK
jgi:hypothetical protein